jgi:hypothetical protein
MATLSTPKAVLRQLPSHASRQVARAGSARLLVVGVLGLLALAPPAAASVGVGTNAGKPQLRVDSKGNAEVSYTFRGKRETVLVPASGAIVPGGRLQGSDVSRSAKKPSLPYLRVLRSGPGGWFYALQTWPARVGPVELRFSRWRGAPTKLTLTARRVASGIALAGKATYGGKPIPIRSRVPGGLTVREYVYLDQRVAGKWKNLGGVSVKRNGSYRKVLFLGEAGSRFRASLAGPNIGFVYAPDMIVQVTPP